MCNTLQHGVIALLSQLYPSISSQTTPRAFCRQNACGAVGWCSGWPEPEYPDQGQSTSSPWEWIGGQCHSNSPRFPAQNCWRGGI